MSSRCITPFQVRDKITNQWMALPCGKCPNCMKRRTSGWSFRLMKEGERSETALFVTLTYNGYYLPFTKNGFRTLDKRDLQLFMKRLRKLSGRKIKYYACGEYGSVKDRPHYHLILFNADPEKVEKAWSFYKTGGGRMPIGNIFIGEVNEASIGYTLKYMQKPGKIPKHQNDDRVKEFSLMSKGLGANYITDNMVNWHKNDLLNRMYVPMLDGKKIAMPRYYKDKMYSDTQKLLINNHLKVVMSDEAVKAELELIKEFGDYAEKVLVERHKNSFTKMYKNTQMGRDKLDKYES
jgi:hypothetical protein